MEWFLIYLFVMIERISGLFMSAWVPFLDCTDDIIWVVHLLCYLCW